jgi:UDP-2-acetamido-3-amino-2,3-dideoxy-glucuronate N-acetyltransferase
MKHFIHALSDVQTKNIGEGTKIWQYVVVLADAVIGKNCNINANVFIENDVQIGNDVTVKSGVQLWDGIRIADGAFIGPNATFTNDQNPRSKQYPERFQVTTILKGASIGANATIIGGNTIGKYAMVGAGAVITKSIGNYELWLGNPARHTGYVSKNGKVLDKSLVDKESGDKYIFENDNLVKAV